MPVYEHKLDHRPPEWNKLEKSKWTVLKETETEIFFNSYITIYAVSYFKFKKECVLSIIFVATHSQIWAGGLLLNLQV